MDRTIWEKAERWAKDTYFNQEFRDEIEALIKEKNEQELSDRFYKELEFGTGGLRGIIGAGSNRMNIYTVRKASQGLANYIKSQGEKAMHGGVAISYDSRRFSETFAHESAGVFAANGIHAYIFPTLQPVPMLSFAVREMKTTAGIMITASHNPPEYNGYKVYWNDGCQITPPHDTEIIKLVQSVQYPDIQTINFDTGLSEHRISYIPEMVDQSYYANVIKLSLADPLNNSKLNLVYTPLHGAGGHPVEEILTRRQFDHLFIVPEQKLPDENFSTVKSPNPEEADAFDFALSRIRENDTLILATDPDADRIGVMVKHQGNWIRLNGNQIGQLLLFYYLSKLQEKGTLPNKGVYITTIVTSELGKTIAESFGVLTKETLTGFKYIGSIIRELEKDHSGNFLFGTEESHGYLFGSFVRDKDGVSACMFFAEMAAELQQKGMTAIDYLDQIHQKFGYHSDKLVNKVIKGMEGAIQIKAIMSYLREHPLKEIAGEPLKEMRDYLTDQIIDAQTGKQIGVLNQLKSNVLAFILNDGSRITVRPSGTEPKIKFYFNLRGADPELLAEKEAIYEREFTKLIDKI